MNIKFFDYSDIRIYAKKFKKSRKNLEILRKNAPLSLKNDKMRGLRYSGVKFWQSIQF